MNEPALPTASPNATHDWSADTRNLGVVLLIAFSSWTFLFGLSGGPPMGDHDCINALAARNALNGEGGWLIPEIHSAPLIRKTPLGVWLIGLSAKIAQLFGSAEPVSALTARLPSALAGIGTALAVCWLGSMLYGARTGIVAGFIAAGSAGIIGYARNAQVDMALTFFVTLTMALFWRGVLCGRPNRRYLAGFYLSFALAMLAKAPLPLVIVGLSIFVYWFVALSIAKSVGDSVEYAPIHARLWTAFVRQLRGIGSLWLIPGVAMFVILVAAWPVYVASQVDTALPLWRIEYLSRFSGDLSDKIKPFHYYIPMVFGLLFPYLGSLPEALALPFLRRYRDIARSAAYPWVWAIVGTVFLSTASFKRPHYLLSVLPAYALLLAPVIDRLFFQAGVQVSRAARAICMALPVLLVGGAIGGGVYVRKETPLLMTDYILAILAAVMVWSLACWAYARSRRVTSFALLSIGTAAALTLGWPGLSTGLGLNAETQALAAALKKFEVDTSRPLYWVDGQPNSTLPFYHAVRVRRLISEVEMASLRTGRSKITEEVYAAAVARIQERLKDEPPAFFVVSAEHFDLFRRRTDMSLREVFRLSGIHEDAEDELVVFTRGDAVQAPTAVP